MSAFPIRSVGVYGGKLLPEDYVVFTDCYCTPEIVDRASIRRVSSDEGREIVGRHDSGDYAGIFFPYQWPGTRECYAHRLRLDNPPYQIKAGVRVPKGKYLSAPGRGNALYFHPDTPASSLTDSGLPIVILEGEKKTLAAFRFAYEVAGETSDTPHSLAIGLSGVYGFRDKRQKAEDSRGRRISISAPIPQLDLINWQDRKVYILFDANVTTNTSVAFARSELALELSSRGAQVWLVDLPVEDGINGFDDYLARHGSGPALRLFDAARLFDPKERLAKLPSTDYGNELAFEILHGADFLYNRNTEQWLRWSGIIYAPDVMGAADRAMLDVAAERLNATSTIEEKTPEETESKRKRYIAGALKLQNVQGRIAALKSATSNPRFAKLAGDFDQHDLLLACGNGVLVLLGHKKNILM